MTEIQTRYCLRHGKHELVTISHRELADIKAQREFHRQQARASWGKMRTHTVKAKHTPSQLAAEREKITQFIATWAPFYPNRFYDFGIYANLFNKHKEAFKRQGHYAAALAIEANAAEMCAAQYDRIAVSYFRQEAGRATDKGHTQVADMYRQRVIQYENVRDAHRQRAVLLRVFAQHTPRAWPPEADRRKIAAPETKTKLTTEKAIHLANVDPRVQEIVTAHQGAHEYAWFQGFAWTVSYYNHG